MCGYLVPRGFIFLCMRELQESQQSGHDSYSPLSEKKKNQEKLRDQGTGAISAKVIYPFEVRVFDEILCNVWDLPDFVIRDFCLP